MMIRTASLFLVAALAAAPALPAAAGPQARYLAGPSDAHRASCHHYENRARFKPRSGTLEFVTLLAEACSAAMVSLERPEPRLHAAAESFLDRLVVLNQVIREMNTERIFGGRALRQATPPEDGKRLHSLPGVSDTGEFLIAHRMGLFTAMDDWLDSGGRFSLALR